LDWLASRGENTGQFRRIGDSVTSDFLGGVVDDVVVYLRHGHASSAARGQFGLSSHLGFLRAHRSTYSVCSDEKQVVAVLDILRRIPVEDLATAKPIDEGH